MPAENRITLTPDTPVRYLKGVGPKTAAAGGCRASGVRQRQTGKTVAFTEGQRYLDEYSFKTSDSSDVSVYADTGGSHGSL